MRNGRFRILAGVVAAGLLAAPVAQAQAQGWHHDGDRGDWHHDHRDRGWHGDRGRDWHDHDRGNGGAVAGALIGLGLGAILGGALASQQPYSAPPPPMVAPPPPPPGYYAAPGPGYPAPPA